MKYKQHKAQRLLEAIGEVDSAILQQAYNTDNPTKFHTLGALKAVPMKKERPNTAMHSWGAFAACLILILLIAASPWIVPSLLPHTQTATQPNQTTTEPIPSTTAPPSPTYDPNAKLQIPQTMTISNDGQKKFRCSYTTSQDSFHPGDQVEIHVNVVNIGPTFTYTGASTDLMGTVAKLTLQGGGYEILSLERPLTDDATNRKFYHRDTTGCSYYFTIPQDAPAGSYIFSIKVSGYRIEFHSSNIREVKYVPVMADLPEDIQKQIWLDGYESNAYQRNKYNIHIYGWFDHTYVFLPVIGYGATGPTGETVNGLDFTDQGGQLMRVVDTEKELRYSCLTAAFEANALTAEQLQEIYDNHSYVIYCSSISSDSYHP